MDNIRILGAIPHIPEYKYQYTCTKCGCHTFTKITGYVSDWRITEEDVIIICSMCNGEMKYTGFGDKNV